MLSSVALLYNLKITEIIEVSRKYCLIPEQSLQGTIRIYLSSRFLLEIVEMEPQLRD
jgi:hypothetical protein